MPVAELSALPEELLLKIFRYLPEKTLAKTAQVSIGFRRISYDSSLWNTITLQSQTLSSDTLSLFLSRGIKRLHIFNCESSKEPLLIGDPPKDGFNLQYLRVKDYKHKLNDEILFIVSHCTQLRDIILEVPSVNDDLCRAIAENSDLEHLNLGCKGFSFAGLLPIVLGCRRLLTLQYGMDVPMTQCQLQTLVETLGDQIKVIDVFRYSDALIDEHVATLVKNCPRMTDLNFSGCPNITEAAMDSLALLCRLDNLNLSDCAKLPSNAIANMPYMKSFKTLWWSIDFTAD